MAVFTFYPKKQVQIDPETNCKIDDQFQDCRQAYYLKKQNDILSKPQTVQTNNTTKEICDYTKYQEESEKLFQDNTNLKLENSQLKNETTNLKVKYLTLLDNSLPNSTRDNFKSLYFNEVMSLNGLLVLLFMVIIFLTYFTYKRKK